MLNRWAIVIAVLYLIAGCNQIPELAHQPSYHNPFPQLKRVGIAPFANVSTEPALDGRSVAMAYAGELQAIPGFEVVPMGIIESKARELHLNLNNASELRLVGEKLKLDAIVIGAITDYSPYYPPRMAMHVDWYAVNPGFQPIPTGYGLPWGTPDEEDIPQSLVDATEFELAREQLKTQTPDPGQQQLIPISDLSKSESNAGVLAMTSPPLRQNSRSIASQQNPALKKTSASNNEREATSEKRPVSSTPTLESPEAAESKLTVNGAVMPANATAELPADWPSPSGLIPAPPQATRPVLRPSIEPVMSHVRSFNGHDVEFTKALQSYATWRDDARFGGWQGYLQRSDDFMRFCCHMHLTEMLTARGGAGESRVVWRWPERR